LKISESALVKGLHDFTGRNIVSRWKDVELGSRLTNLSKIAPTYVSRVYMYLAGFDPSE
jgi:hypothetical protein